MRTHELTWPDLALIAGTRVALGAGIGLLVAPRLSRDQRRAAGSTLLAVGVLTTLPLVARVFRPPVERARARSEPVLSI
jgi:hypothetical protein